MRVIIGTGKKEIDQMIQRITGGFPPVTYREGVLLQHRKNKAELAFLSPVLQGNVPFEQLLYELRKEGVRVVVLVGHAKPKEMREKWLPVSVYDYILDPVTEEKIRFAVEYPATLGMAEEKIALLENGEVEKETEKTSSKWTAWLGKKQKRGSKDEKADSGKEAVFNDSPALELFPRDPGLSDQTEWVFTQDPQAEVDRATQPVETSKQENYAISVHAPKAAHEFQQDPVFQFDTSVLEETKPQPKGYNIIVTSPSATGKTYVALNLAATLSKQGMPTKLVSFEGETDIWTYLDMPAGKQGHPQGYPNLTVETVERMKEDGHYRVIDLPYENWGQLNHWEDVLVLYIEDMDIHRKKLGEKEREKWQGKRLLRVLNRFVPNVLESGQEQKLRMDADIVLSDQPVHYVAMRYGRPAIHLDQNVAREFEFAAKTVLASFPGKRSNLYSIS